MPGEKGIIPGSLGTASYIVEGLGNPESFMSCSHGAKAQHRCKTAAMVIYSVFMLIPLSGGAW